MSHPKKIKTWRNITVGGIRYRWRFRSGRYDSSVTLHGDLSGGQQAMVMLRGCPDVWLAFPTPVPWVKVTPETARRMIGQALARGWQSARHLAPLTFDFERETPADCPGASAHPAVVLSAILSAWQRKPAE